jgi:uncharacterized protein YacL
MDEDAIVAEVRVTRKKIEEATGNDFKALNRKMLELQKQFADRLVTSPLPLSQVTELKGAQPAADSA